MKPKNIKIKGHQNSQNTSGLKKEPRSTKNKTTKLTY